MAEGNRERRLAAIVIADVVGYSKLVQADEEGTRDLFSRLQDEVFQPKLSGAGGRVVKTMGDAFLLEFPSAVAAVRCAMDIQRTLPDAQSDVPEERQIRFRVGINVGDIIVEGDDLHGDGVNVTARLESLADPGGVCISRSVYDQVRGKNDFEYQYLGAQQARNLLEPIRAYRVLSDEAPPATSFELTDERGQLVLPERPSVVVLPFANISGDPSADSLAEGIRVDIQNALTRVSGVFLVAIASANAYRGKPSKQATEKYAVRYALEGNVRKAENRIRVSFTLTDNISSEIVWADQVDRDLENTFQVFDEITGHVLTALNVKLVAGEPAKIWHKSLKDFRSLEALYAGIFDFYRMTADAMEVAREQFERVAKWNPDVSAGPTWMAVTHWVDFQRGWSAPRDESLRLAKTWAQKAIGLIGCDGQAYTILCHIHLVEKDAQAAIELGKEAISIRPNCTAAHSHFANVLHYCGEQDAALHNIQLAMRFSPIQQPIYNEIIARIYRAQERYDRAIVAADKAIAANPNCLLSRLVLASIGVIRDERAREAQLREEILRIEPDFSVAQFAEGQPYRDRQFLDRWCSELLDAGLPE